jgi:molecular chaperone HtpG
MTEAVNDSTTEGGEPISFKAETRQLLDILIHSLYTERDIFLRELISNASDALTRVAFETLTNRDMLDADAELSIRIIPDEDENTLTIRDNGIGMTAEELVTNLGTIAQSGAREFLAAAKDSAQVEGGSNALGDLIGQFGVGFYSAFMVAEWIRVESRSYLPDAQAASWYCTGADTFTVEPAEKETRGTDVIIKLKEDASDLTGDHRLSQIVRKYSDFIPYPITIGEKSEQVNRQTAIWRQSPREVDDEDYNDFYKQLTLDYETPLAHAHMAVDAPVQMYALLFIPSNPEGGMFSLRKDVGLKLFARKVLIQEYNKDLLPEYLGFVDGVVDSEDLPLNVSRESVQSNRVMSQLGKLITSKVLDTLKDMAENDTQKYNRFWEGYNRYIKQGVSVEQLDPEPLHPLLRFHSTSSPDEWISLDQYIERMQPDQSDIYYIMGDDERSLMYSPHLDVVRQYDYEVLLMADPVDAFMLVRLNEYQEHKLVNVAGADLEMPSSAEGAEDEIETAKEGAHDALLERFKSQLGDKVNDVRTTRRLSDSPARLVDPEGALNQEMQRVYRLLNQEYDVPKKVLELNPKHAIIQRLNELPADDPMSPLIIEQIYEDTLLIEGLHPDPASMIGRIQELMEAALE